MTEGNRESPNTMSAANAAIGAIRSRFRIDINHASSSKTMVDIFVVVVAVVIEFIPVMLKCLLLALLRT